MLADFYTHCVCVFGGEGVIALGLNNIFVLCKTWKQELWFSQRCKMPKGVCILFILTRQTTKYHCTSCHPIRLHYIYNICYLIWCHAKTNVGFWIIYDAYRRIGACVWVHVATLSLALSAISVVQPCSKGCWFPRNKTWQKEEEWVSTKHMLGLSSWLKKQTNPKTLKISILIRKFTLPCLHLLVCMKTECIIV